VKRDSSPLAGKTVKIRADVTGLGGQEYRVEDWWQNVFGQSWTTSQSPAAYAYALRSSGGPVDDDVLYGKVGSLGHLVHVSEIEQ
jgi:hypothetical protein